MINVETIIADKILASLDGESLFLGEGKPKLPYVIFTIDDQPDDSFDDLFGHAIEVICVTNSYNESKALCRTLQQALSTLEDQSGSNWHMLYVRNFTVSPYKENIVDGFASTLSFNIKIAQTQEV